MLKLNKKGFALVETLIVTVFVATIFTIMYTNFFPMIGEYERREGYDDVDSIYRTYLVKKMFENNDFKAGVEGKYNGYKAQLGSQPFLNIFSVDYQNTSVANETAELSIRDASIRSNCNNLTSNGNTVNYCIRVMNDAKVSNIYLTKYNLAELKGKIKKGKISDNQMNVQMQDYIDSLPYYKNNPNNYNYRVIIQYAKEINKESTSFKNVIYGFSTIGVNL